MDTIIPPQPVTPPPPPASEDKTVAILSYITVVGFIIAIVMHGNKKTALGAFHLKQVLGLFLTAVAAALIAIIPIIGWFCWIILWIGLVIFWLIGFLGAINGSMKPVPILGAKYQEWFRNAF